MVSNEIKWRVTVWRVRPGPDQMWCQWAATVVWRGRQPCWLNSVWLLAGLSGENPPLSLFTLPQSRGQGEGEVNHSRTALCGCLYSWQETHSHNCAVGFRTDESLDFPQQSRSLLQSALRSAVVYVLVTFFCFCVAFVYCMQVIDRLSGDIVASEKSTGKSLVSSNEFVEKAGTRLSPFFFFRLWRNPCSASHHCLFQSPAQKVQFLIVFMSVTSLHLFTSWKSILGLIHFEAQLSNFCMDGCRVRLCGSAGVGGPYEGLVGGAFYFVYFQCMSCHFLFLFCEAL